MTTPSLQGLRRPLRATEWHSCAIQWLYPRTVHPGVQSLDIANTRDESHSSWQRSRSAVALEEELDVFCVRARTLSWHTSSAWNQARWVPLACV